MRKISDKDLLETLEQERVEQEREQFCCRRKTKDWTKIEDPDCIVEDKKYIYFMQKYLSKSLMEVV